MFIAKTLKTLFFGEILEMQSNRAKQYLNDNSILLHFITIIFHAEQNLRLSQHIIEFTLYSVFGKHKCQKKIIHMYHYFKRTVFINNKRVILLIVTLCGNIYFLSLLL